MSWENAIAPVRERIAARLGVALLMLRSGAQSWIARGAAIVSVLGAVMLDGGLLDRLLAAGGGSCTLRKGARWPGGQPIG